MAAPLLDVMRDRVLQDREDGDIAYFFALGYYAEHLTKAITAGLLACIGDDVDRHRYALEHRLVRANAIGDWSDALLEVLTGRAAQFLLPAARDCRDDLAARLSGSAWQYRAVRTAAEVAAELGAADSDSVGAKAALRQVFPFLTAIRNKTRGHGAPTVEQCNSVCTRLHGLLDDIASHARILRLPWVHLHQNLSGKYRVTPLLGDAEPFDFLKKEKHHKLASGVYLFLDRPTRVFLAFSAPGAADVAFPNGQFRNGFFEIRSYISNEESRGEATPWLDPPDSLPASHTEGPASLDVVGNAMGNLPPMPEGYVKRSELEGRLLAELRDTERHPMLSLTGSGGIGKTTLALASLWELVADKQPAYEVVVWISARDIDLLERGPKPVAPRVLTLDDIALAVCELLEPEGLGSKGFDAKGYFRTCLTEGAAGNTLFVLDNYETVGDPIDTFRWIDSAIRPPNKVILTTRFRDFAGDFPIEVSGMSDCEARVLVDREAARLGIGGLLNDAYVDRLLDESDGHPYVIKMLLGEAAKDGKLRKPKRVVASKDDLLRALFERTYSAVTPAAQRVFLLLCSWRVPVPAVAVEAVSLRASNDRFDVRGALDELRRYSLIDTVEADADGQVFVSVPLAASLFGARKLQASPFRVSVEEDRKLLMEVGAASADQIRHGVLPRVLRLAKSVARQVSSGSMDLDATAPVLEYIASQVPACWRELSRLMIEVEGPDSPRGRQYLTAYLESEDGRCDSNAWLDLAGVCKSAGDLEGELAAYVEIAELPRATPDDVSWMATRANNALRASPGARSGELRDLLERLVDRMVRELPRLDGTAFSRLAWLYLNLGDEDNARLAATRGLKSDSANYHCERLLERLGQ